MRFDNEQYMAQEEKDILIADLCGRLPYGLIIKCNDGFRQSKEKLVSIDVGNGLINYDWRLTDIKPFLRPLSSMTEEECDELKQIMKCDAVTDDSLQYAVGGCVDYDDFLVYYEDSYKLNDWLNKNMFDYRGLIPKGLTLEAPEGMYNN